MMTRAGRALRSLLLAYLAASCATWSHPSPPQTALREINGKRVAIVSLRDSTTFRVAGAQVSGDSLVGVTDAGRFSRPLASINYLSVRRTSTPRTLAAVVIIVAVVGLVLFTGFYTNTGTVTY